MLEHEPNPDKKRPIRFVNEAGAIEEEIGMHDEEMTDAEIAAEESAQDDDRWEL